MLTPREIVRSGYDRVSQAYWPDDAGASSPTYQRYAEWLGRLAAELAPGSAVLDLGCGCGVPVCRLLVGEHRVTGVDLSPVQVDRARRLVPGAAFVCTDMCHLQLQAGAWDAIICLYALIHVPLEEQRPLLERISSWLRPGGLLLISAGAACWTGTEEDWLGVPGGTMYWSHADSGTYETWFASLGLRVEWQTFVPEGRSGHPLYLLRGGTSA